MIINKIYIEKFRAIKDLTLPIGKRLTAISGRNATMKSTLLGIISQPFSITAKDNPMYGCKTIDGYNFRSQFSEKFKLDPDKDRAGEHKWTLYLEQGIYKSSEFVCASITRSKKNPLPRFWNAKSKSAGAGYIQQPVYYLSLSRLLPIGEVRLNNRDIPSLNKVETEYYVKLHKQILVNNDPGESSAGYKWAPQKLFSGINAPEYSVLANSSGEDNIGRIITSILSFKRLKEQHPHEYKGGIFLIDEIDASLYPWSQRSLIRYLYDVSKELQLQIIFTTHSECVLRTVDELSNSQDERPITHPDYCFDNCIIHMSKNYVQDQGICISGSPIRTRTSFRELLADIELRSPSPNKLKLYCEDHVAFEFIKSIMSKDVCSYIEPIDINLGYTNYISLHKKAIPEFLNNIIVLDGDVRYKKPKEDYTYCYGQDNIIFLPIEGSIEEYFYKYLRDRNNYSKFENKFQINYDLCFRSYTQEKCSTSADYKAWFNNELGEFLHNDYAALYTWWKGRERKKARLFSSEIKAAFNALAKAQCLDSIE